MRAKAVGQGNKVWPNLEAPKGFMQGPYPSGRSYSNPPAPGKVRSSLGPASPGAVEHALKEGSGRITKINEGTRAGVRKRIQEAIEQGMSPAEAGAYVREWTGFDEYRAERIARTEMMFSYNAAATRTYAELGVTHVVADDGDEDEECAERHGQVFTVEEAADILDHPNGTLDWLPVEPTMGAEKLTGELSALRPFQTPAPAPVVNPLIGQAHAIVAKLQQGEVISAAESDILGQAAAQQAVDPAHVIQAVKQGQAKQAMLKVQNGVDITPDEGTLISDAIKQGAITQDQYLAAYKEGNQRKLAQKVLAKLNAGENATATEMDALDLAVDQGFVTADDVSAALAQQKIKQTLKQDAADLLNQISQGNGSPWQASTLDQYVQQGVISQQQVDQAYIQAQLLKQKQGIQAAIDAMEANTATDTQKQLVMDALSQGALDPAQQAQLTKIIVKQAPKVPNIQPGLVMPTTQAEWQNALFQVTTSYATQTEKEQVLMGIMQGMLTPDQELGVAKGLVNLMKSGKQLDPLQQQIADQLLNKGVMSQQHYFDAVDALNAKLAGAPPPVPAPAPAPAPVTQVAKPASKLKGKGAGKVKDTFNDATFAPKQYATREEHARSLAAWQRKTNSNLSWQAKDAMQSYTNSGYTEMNGMLRDVGNQYRSAQEMARIQEQVDGVRQSMHATTQDLVVRRGTTSHMFGAGGNTQVPLDDLMIQLQPGQQYVENGFMSTSINRGHSWSGDVLLELKVPKGTSAAWAQTISHHKSEFEVLLDAGTRIVIESVDRPTYGQVHIVAHVIK